MITERRYPLAKDGHAYRYGDWHIAPSSWLRPSPAWDWDWYHDDYDGAEDANDHRCGSAASPEACIDDIHEWEDDHD
jgi:hypothetical protein